MRLRAKYHNKETKKHVDGVVTLIGTSHALFHEVNDKGQLDHGELLPLSGRSKLAGVSLISDKVIIMRKDGNKFYSEWKAGRPIPVMTEDKDQAQVFDNPAAASATIRRLAAINIGGYIVTSAE